MSSGANSASAARSSALSGSAPSALPGSVGSDLPGSAPSAPSGPGRGPLAAAGFAGLFLAGMLVTGLLGTGTMPSPFDSEQAAASFFADNKGPLLVQGLLHLLSGLALGLYARARTAPNGLSRAAGWGAAASLAASGLLTASVPVLDVTGDTLHTLHYLTFLSGGQIHVPLLGLLVGALARAGAGAAPRWITVLGLVSAALSVASLVSFATEAAMLLLPLGRFTAILWLLITAVRPRPAE